MTYNAEGRFWLQFAAFVLLGGISLGISIGLLIGYFIF